MAPRTSSPQHAAPRSPNAHRMQHPEPPVPGTQHPEPPAPSTQHPETLAPSIWQPGSPVPGTQHSEPSRTLYSTQGPQLPARRRRCTLRTGSFTQVLVKHLLCKYCALSWWGTNKAASLPTTIAVSPFRGSQTLKRTGQGTRDMGLTPRGAWGRSGKLSWRGDACVLLTRTVKTRPDGEENTRRQRQRNLVWRVMNVLKTPR